MSKETNNEDDLVKGEDQMITTDSDGNSGAPVAYGDPVNLMLGLLPVIALALYWLSYQISCKVYMKGAEQYDK